MATVGEKIKVFRVMNKMTQKELGERIGCTQSAVYMWETGKSTPSLGKIEKIAVALGVAVADIISNNDADDADTAADDETIVWLQAKKGRWIRTYRGRYNGYQYPFVCSNCGLDFDVERTDTGRFLWNYCPRCGAFMSKR